ncbi:MAG: MJ0042-type zinc finger domain-containing protein [Gemmataceae bacterium]
MAQVVKAQCPGCGTTLRIPTDWLGRPVRCKKCGTSIQATGPVNPRSVPVTQPTPVPLSRPSSPPTAAMPTPQTATQGRDTLAAPLATPVANPAHPATLPPPNQPSSTAAFDFGAPSSDESVQRDSIRSYHRRGGKRRRSSGTWLYVTMGGVALLCLVAAVLVLTNLKQVKDWVAQVRDPNRFDPDRKPSSTADNKTKGKKPLALGKAGYPRRALIISTHNYLYANPITAGMTGQATIDRLVSSLNRALQISLTQIVHLSDAHPKTPRPPLKTVIEKTIQNFLATSRRQDRIMLIWVGHTKEIDGKAYLVPLEGEFDNPQTLLPLSWVYEQLAATDCRQKILVLDGNRHNLAQGEERPVSGPMTEAFEKELENPPKGVQVWSACSKNEESNEIEDYPLGIFLDAFRRALTPEPGDPKGVLEGRIQSPNELIPMEDLHKHTSMLVASETKRLNLKKQTPLLAGSPPAEGAEYDPEQVAAEVPALPVVSTANQGLVRQLLEEISVPSLQGGKGTGADLNFSNLPPFPTEAMKKYQTTLPADHPLRQAVQKGRVVLWAISTADVPPELQAEVQKIREKLQIDLSILETRYNRPGGGQAETDFKNSFEGKSRNMSRIIAQLENAHEELEMAKQHLTDETPARWKAHYNYILARFKAQLAFLEEYNNLLGGLRRELPAAEEIHTGWRMAARERPGDSVGKRYERAARKIYGELIEEHPKSPWEVLGKREKLNALGLEWQAF